MRVFIAVLVLIFSLQSWTKADDISDFQVLGMSVGDSALNYFSENEINQFKYGFESKLFAYVNIEKNKLEDFNDGFILIKPKDKNFLIHSIVVRKFFNDNIIKCYKEQNKTVKDLLNILESANESDKKTYAYSADKSGKSTVTTINLKFDDGSSAHIGCYNMNKEYLKENDFNPETALLSISVNSKVYYNWQLSR